MTTARFENLSNWNVYEFVSHIDLLYSSLRLVTSAYMFPNGNILRLRSQAISIHHQRVTSDIFVHIEQTHVSWQRNVQLRSCVCIATRNLRKSAIMRKPTIGILKSKQNLKTGVVQHLITTYTTSSLYMDSLRNHVFPLLPTNGRKPLGSAVIFIAKSLRL